MYFPLSRSALLVPVANLNKPGMTRGIAIAPDDRETARGC